jgi:single-strand DNA-binding protein
MINATVSGRITKDAAIRQAGNSNVCSFGMASNKKVKGNDVTTFVDVSIFGARGEKLVEFLTKGSFVVASGELSTREHNGKTYVQLDCQSINLGPRQSGAQNGSQRQESKPADDYDTGGGDTSDIPFGPSDPRPGLRRLGS